MCGMQVTSIAGENRSLKALQAGAGVHLWPFSNDKANACFASPRVQLITHHQARLLDKHPETLSCQV